MSIPEFTAEASLYKTSNRYRSSSAEFGGTVASQSVVAALTHDDTVNCESCENRCNVTAAECTGIAVAAWTAGLAVCAVTGPFAPVCAIPVTGAYALANAGCLGKLAACRAINCDSPGSPCCPVFCELGHCCSHGETCMPQGCCPSNQIVCGGECCGLGESCCGDTCCPPNYFCRDGGFCSEFPSDFLPPNSDPPKPPINNCIFGGEPCGRKCCPPGLQCCGDGECRGSCIN